jgi:tetratricopeptide (TPR) repeat protein
VTNPIVDPLIGRTVAHYEILARLGGGGMGVVYRARDTRLGRVVALKFLPQQWSHDEDAKQRFIREAQAASATDHRNICTIHDIGTADDGQLFIVMAYYEGVTLKQRLDASGALTVDEALDIATQVAEGLARAHAQGVVHRDIKPGNLVLAEDGVRILDFGLATFANALQLTIVGSTLGTAAYMSPEQVRGEAAGPASDVWAVGAILYQMLAGHVPFQGAYAEAIAYAIKHETPAPLRQKRPEVPEEVEQLVFRALHKDASVRYPTGRELARALRQVRGQTVPMDLRTEAVDAPQRLAQLAPAPVKRSRKRLLVAVAAVVVALGGGAGWAMWPRARTPIVVVPVANQTGFADLGPYQLALTYALVHELSDSRVVRPMSWPRMLQTLRGFIATEGADLSSGAVVQALRDSAVGDILVRPTLVNEDKTWHVQVELVDRRTAVTLDTFQTGAVATSVLRKDLAYSLMGHVADQIEDRFDRRWFRGVLASARQSAPLLSLDTAKAFAEGIDAYEEQEYATAHEAFTRAEKQDGENPLIPAWLARSARAMRKDLEASSAGSRALALLKPQTPQVDRWFVEAAAAEAGRNPAVAETNLAALSEAFGDDPQWLMERAALQERTASSEETLEAAVLRYHEVIDREPGDIRAQLELCRLYNRLQNTQDARAAGTRALDAARASRWAGAEALSRMCLADALRQGSEADRTQAQQHAQTALQMLERLGFSYNAPRAHFYLGVTAYELGQIDEAVRHWTAAQKGAESAGNIVLQPIVLSNLGAAYEGLGDGALALDFFTRSAAMYERLGDQRRAARQQRNFAATRIRYGEQADEGFKQATAVLEVVRARGDAEYEIGLMELIGDYYRLSARYEEASVELNKALQLANTHNLAPRVTATTMALARLQFEEAAYEDARRNLASVVRNEPPSAAAEGWIALGRVHARLGDFQEANSRLTRVAQDMASRANAPLRPFLYLSLGELAYESDRLVEARGQFDQAVRFWRDRFSIEAAVEARAYRGLIDATLGRPAKGREDLEASLARATAMGRVALEVLCRVFLGRVYLAEGRARDAVAAFDALPAARVAALGRELRLQVHYWRAQARHAAGEDATADREAARQLYAELRESVPEAHRTRWAARRDIRVMAQ